MINSCDVIVGFYLLSIAINDVLVGGGGNYVQVDISWRRSIPCHMLSFVSLLAIMLSALFLMVVSISRYRIIRYPLDKPFSIANIKIVKICLPMYLLYLYLLLHY